MGLSVGSWRKKKRRCGSDKSAHDLGRDKSKNASILRKYGSICMGKKPRLFYNITEDVKARKANAFENFPAFDLIAFIVVVFYERNSDNGLICIPIVYKPFEIG